MFPELLVKVLIFSEVITCCCSVNRLYPTFCNSIDCSMPGFHVLYYLLEFAQTHIYWVHGAIQPSHPLSPSSLPTLTFSQHQVFPNESTLSIRWSKCWSFTFSISTSNKYSRLISLRIYWFLSFCYSRDSQESYLFFKMYNFVTF